ncbi:HNH endonuclease [Terriglobus roseus]|uniref:HNH endonuclease n=1 Tax=Terriglobus roseus TaxID=392734 RepID=A0A1G7G4S1_9BACT|nr:HNH endonuclease [Terriglobus roseus]SDE83166.1 HNH endonuclease [Terriglobus roseus]
MATKSIENFQSKTTATNACTHIWNGNVSRNGYGLYRDPVTGKTVYAHRFAYEMHNGPIPDTYEEKPSVIMHKCDNRLCVSRDCLLLANQALNMADKKAKKRCNPNRKFRGPNLTRRQLAVFHRLMDRGFSNYQICKMCGKSESHMHQIRKKYNQAKQHAIILEMIKWMLAIPTA